MDFYTNFFLRGNKLYLRGYSSGLPYEEVIWVKPYLFAQASNGKYKTIDGKTVSKIDFSSVREARDFNEKYKNIEQFSIYGSTNFGYVYINDRFKGEVDFDASLISKVTLDIETDSEDGFPDIALADKKITSIAIRKKNKSAVFSYGDFVTTDPNIYYVKCASEEELITRFLKVWTSDAWKPDIVTGWYIEFFDIPYLINRITRLLGIDIAKKLSPWKMLDERKIEFKGKEVQSYTIAGISVLDYMSLYKKFSFKNHESFKLDFIAEHVTGIKKIDYSEYGSLHELYVQNFQKFIEYNIHDCILVDKIDEKEGMIDQVLALAYDAKINYNDTLTTVRSWDTIIHNELMNSGIVVPPIKNNGNNGGFNALTGGYVKDPKLGKHKWVVSFDLDSLYPHLIMQYNISPETFVERLHDFPSIDTLLEVRDTGMKGSVYSYAANGCVYMRSFQGFLPRIMEKKYNERSKFKQLSIEAKLRYQESKNIADENLRIKYHNLQLAKKIQLNAAYGALANEYFRWFNFNHAEAITMSGQLAIRWIEQKMNAFMNNMMKTKNVDYVIASDTDSIYMNMGPVVDALNLNDKSDIEISRILDKFSKSRIAPFINNAFEELAMRMNAYKQAMRMKRETIANRAIWTAKKMYIMNSLNDEGVEYTKPKLKVQGIAAVRSSTPQVCRTKIIEALAIMMEDDVKPLRNFVEAFRTEFMNMNFEQVASPRSMNGMNKYRDASNIYKKGAPIHVKGALLFNDLLKKNNIKNIAPISDGDKIKYAYLKLPNPIKDSVISVPDILPKQFGLDKYIDRELQFEKSFFDPINSIARIIGWQLEERASLESFFA